MPHEPKQLARFLPGYPSTPHLPYKPHVPAEGSALASVLASPTLIAEEKLDGANCAVMLLDGHFVIRNRDHVLKKGYVKKETPAKLQFRSLWNWAVERRRNFELLNARFGYAVGVYGEWLWALHGIVYDQLPDYFVAFDIYDPERHEFIAPNVSRPAMEAAGFECAPLLASGPIGDAAKLAALCNDRSAYGPGQREGVYLKEWAGTDFVTARFKVVREGYVQGALWSHEKLTKQRLRKK